MYRLNAAGHAARVPPRTVEQESIDDALFKIAEEWLSDVNRLDFMLGDLKTTATRAALLSLDPRLKTHGGYHALGRLITGVWNTCCQETTLVYDHDTPDINYLGNNLAEEKVLIIRGRIGDWTGNGARGPIIITGAAGTHVGSWSNVPIIIAGQVGGSLGYMAKGILITLTQTEVSRTFDNVHYEREEYEQNTPLKEYVDGLLALAREDPSTIEKEFGDGKKITSSIRCLIGGTR